MKALENCSSPPLQNLLLKDGKLSSLYTTQGNLLCVCGTSFFCFTGRQIRLSLNSRVPASCSCCLLWSTLTHLSRQLVIATFQKAHVCLDICMIQQQAYLLISYASGVVFLMGVHLALLGIKYCLCQFGLHAFGQHHCVPDWIFYTSQISFFFGSELQVWRLLSYSSAILRLSQRQRTSGSHYVHLCRIC